MILVINIENRDTVFGIFENDKLLKKFKIKTDISKSVDELVILFKILIENEGFNFKDIEDVIISSVVVDMIYKMESFVKKYMKIDPMLVGVGIKTGLNIRCENPREVGTDRIVNAVAALDKYESPLIIVDIGSVITFDVIDKNKNYLGGLILPGIMMAQESLIRESSKLPKVEIVKPKKIIGNTTVRAIQSGIYYQYVSLFDGVIREIIKELNEEKDNVNIVVTGSFLNLITEKSDYHVDLDRDLSLKGLYKLYKMNKK